MIRFTVNRNSKLLRFIVALPFWVPVDILPARIIKGQGLSLFHTVTIGHRAYWRNRPIIMDRIN